MGRFISPDTNSVISATPTALTDKNLYAYCDNNPIMRKDSGGKFWETVFDIVSLAFSVVDVVKNPKDPWAWAGLAGDAIDLIPFVAGVGEVTKAISKTNKIIDTVDDVHDAAKVVDNVGDTGKAISKTDVLAKNKATGDLFENQKFDEFSSNYRNAEKQITIKTSEGKVRVDAIGLDDNGNVIINEFKSSNTAPYTKNQKVVFPDITKSGGTVVGKGKGIFKGDYHIPAGTNVITIRPY